MLLQFSAYHKADTGQELQLFHVVSSRRAGLSISDSPDLLGVSLTTVFPQNVFTPVNQDRNSRPTVGTELLMTGRTCCLVITQTSAHIIQGGFFLFFQKYTGNCNCSTLASGVHMLALICRAKLALDPKQHWAKTFQCVFISITLDLCLPK